MWILRDLSQSQLRRAPPANHITASECSSSSSADHFHLYPARPAAWDWAPSPFPSPSPRTTSPPKPKEERPSTSASTRWEQIRQAPPFVYAPLPASACAC